MHSDETAKLALRKLCAPKMKVMMMENKFWTFRAFDVACKPDDAERGDFDVDMPVMQEDQRVVRRSVEDAFDQANARSRSAQVAVELAQHLLDPEFACEPEEHAHIADTLAKLLRFISNLKTHREMSQSMSKNSKLDDEGVFGMTKFDAVPVRGAMADTALGRKRGWYEKMIHVHKQKARKGEQSSIREFLS